MSGTITQPTGYIDATGIHVPSLTDIQSYLIASYQSIYGSDIDLGADTQDGQLIGIIAAMLNDAYAMAVATYASFSPQTAQGVALSNNVKINGLARNIPTQSTVNVALVGQAGTPINSGTIIDDQNNTWDLPASVTIPTSGTITVTATAENAGALNVASGTVFTIGTPTKGWQSATATSNAVTGAPVETDAALRVRQSISTQAASQSVLGGIVGALLQVTGVTEVQPYVNNTTTTDANGVPANSLAMVITGGSITDIVNVIGDKTGPGAGLYGSTSATYTDPASGATFTVAYFVTTLKPVIGTITIKALNNYTATIGDEILAAVAAAINALKISDDVQYTRLYAPACLIGPYASPASPNDTNTFELQSIELALSGGTVAAADVAIAFNEKAITTVADLTLVVN